MFIELHLIQNFAPSNLNRDDTNNPKDCEFGGHRRARISSQSLKRAIRRMPVFARTTGAMLGERSKWMARPIRDRLISAGKPEADAQAVATAFVSAYAGKMDAKSPEKTSVLIYFSHDELQRIVDGLLANWDTTVTAAANGKTDDALVKQLVKDTQNRTGAPDIALFGRMLAEKPELNIDAACQVAHAISTHRINMEMDFYTAVDDLQTRESDEGAGAGMMGFTGFNSACFYRYARVDWRQLVENLGGDVGLARRTVEGFLRAALDAIPSGKQNSFAAQNPTSLALAVVREDGQSWNLANAFENPVRPGRETGLVEPSIRVLDSFWGNLTRARDDASPQVVAVFTDQHQEALARLKPYYLPTLTGWLGAVSDALPQE